MNRLPNLIQALYKSTIQPILFQMDAEKAHEWAVRRLTKLQASPSLLNFFRRQFVVKDPRLEIQLKGLVFPNPVGLAAGFDKGGDFLEALPAFGFGFIEAGTFTPKPQTGQDRPRLFRFKEQQALINRMGFNNPGVDVLEDRFNSINHRTIPIGVNLGKNKATPNERALDDYEIGIKAALPFASYIVINVSSPNTPGLRELQELDALEKLLDRIAELNEEFAKKHRVTPTLIFTKIAPDLHLDTIDEIAKICVKKGSGVIATNTTIDHSLLGPHRDEAGGLSGRPLKDKSNAILKKVYKITRRTVPIIGVGGIFSAEDAFEKIRLGADLIQVYTGWIYEGPALVSNINRGLLRLLKSGGFQTVQDAVGTSD